MTFAAHDANILFHVVVRCVQSCRLGNRKAFLPHKSNHALVDSHQLVLGALCVQVRQLLCMPSFARQWVLQRVVACEILKARAVPWPTRNEQAMALPSLTRRPRPSSSVLVLVRRRPSSSFVVRRRVVRHASVVVRRPPSSVVVRRRPLSYVVVCVVRRRPSSSVVEQTNHVIPAKERTPCRLPHTDTGDRLQMVPCYLPPKLRKADSVELQGCRRRRRRRCRPFGKSLVI